MNDDGYIDETFEGSMNETSIKMYKEEELKHVLPYYLGAVKYHTSEQNPRQIKFFQAGADLIRKRLNRMGAGQET